MRVFLVIISVVLAFELCGQPPVDGWSKGAKNVDGVVSYTYETFSKYYAGTDLVRINRNTQSVNFFGAAGLTNWLDIQASLPIIITKKNYSGLQDFSVFLKGKFLNKELNSGNSISFFGSVGYSTPMTAYETESLFAIGQQATALDFRGIIQFKHSTGWFIMGQSGHTAKFDPVPSSLPIAFKMGRAKAKYYWDVWLDYQQAFGGTDYRDGSNSPFTTLGVLYTKVGGSFYKPIKNGSSGIAGGVSYVLNGRNVGQAMAISMSFIQKIGGEN